MFATLFLAFFLLRDALETPFNKEVRDISREVAEAIFDWQASRAEAPRNQRPPFAFED